MSLQGAGRDIGATADAPRQSIWEPRAICLQDAFILPLDRTVLRVQLEKPRQSLSGECVPTIGENNLSLWHATSTVPTRRFSRTLAISTVV